MLKNFSSNNCSARLNQTFDCCFYENVFDVKHQVFDVYSHKRNQEALIMKLVFFCLMKLTNETMSQINRQLFEKLFDVNEIYEFDVDTMMFCVREVVVC